jgi:hypothetical protein
MNIEEWIRGARRGSMMVEKQSGEIGRMRKSRKQNEDEVKLRKVEDAIENVGSDRGIRMTGSRNVEANGESLKSLDVARGTSDESTGRSRGVELRKRQRGGGKEGHWPLKISISDRHTEKLYEQYLEKGRWDD